MSGFRADAAGPAAVAAARFVPGHAEETILSTICNGPAAFLRAHGAVEHLMDIEMPEHLAAAHA
jgi:hypothetical protein